MFRVFVEDSLPAILSDELIMPLHGLSPGSEKEDTAARRFHQHAIVN